MQRSGRLLQLLQNLRERRGAVTAKALASQFGVSERTIYRDMETLLALGVPVEGEAGTGFILRPGFFLPSMAFTRDEADAILLGLRFVLAVIARSQTQRAQRCSRSRMGWETKKKHR